MGRVHELIELKGRAGAILALQDDCDRRIVDTAASYMADEENGVGFIFSGWAQAALPHRRLKSDDSVWQLETERVRLMVEPGRRPIPGGDPVWVGVPYGSRARLIMLYLQTEALRTGRREIELGRSLHAWLGRLSIPIGGKSFRDVREQAERISRCRMTFQISQGGRTGLVNQHILDTAMFVEDGQDGQGSLFIETARLSEMFFEQLQKHPVPLEEAAIRAINNNSQALDIYCWLAYRLHVLPGPREISWKALHAQFGAGFARLDHFRTKFIENLKLATAVYRDAAIEISKSGLILKPSRSPIAPRQVAISR
ncbi:MAG TPA: replication protein RepA [Acetobacteraceae bacterium]|nr:replication protein RepA [Acetobacteraceae bacterium]